MDHRPFYVTTPIYYVNDKPHIGHAYTTILADVLARGHRLLGDPTHFLTGTDEHGLKVQQAAQKNGVSPQEQCDTTVLRFQELWKKLGITSDDFIRTTETRHKTVVQQILTDLHQQGLIYSAEYEGWYCVPCERFFMEKDLIDGACPDCHRPVERLTEKNYFFRMSQYQQQLIDYIESHPDFIQPAHRRQETLGFLRQPLGDLCISRAKSRLAWGIELPFDSDYVTYVWFDALVNYISAVGYKSDAKKFQKWWPASYHLIGKDILTTHTIYWPTMLMAMGLEQPRTIFAHGWWLTDGHKVSKSALPDSNRPHRPVNPIVLADTYGVDALRYYLMGAMSLGQDAQFSEDAFILKFNAELANDLGNLTSRAIKMLEHNFAGLMPPAAEPTAEDAPLREACKVALVAMQKALDTMHLDRGVAEVNGAVRAANRYFDQMKPWLLAKNGDMVALGVVLRNVSECLRIVSGLLFPIMPGKMSELRTLLGIPAAEIEPQMERLKIWNVLPAGVAVKPVTVPLFPRIEVAKPEPAPVLPAKAVVAEVVGNPVGVIGIEDVLKVSLKTAVVLAAEPVPDADRLLKLRVSLGSEERQIIAGIATFYRPEALVGKTIVVVANLKPRQLRGLTSEGMLLAAKNGERLTLLTTDADIPPGSSVG